MKIFTCIALLIATLPAFSQDQTSSSRLYYLEVGASVIGQYEASRLTAASYPLALLPGSSVKTDWYSLDGHSGSPSFEVGMSLDARTIWLFAGTEFHPMVKEYDGTSRLFENNTYATIGHKTIRGNSIYMGLLFERKVFSFFGIYARAAAGYFRFEHSVEVDERNGSQFSSTVHVPVLNALGASGGLGIFFDLSIVKFRLGYRALYCSGGSGNTVSSDDFRFSTAIGF